MQKKLFITLIISVCVFNAFVLFGNTESDENHYPDFIPPTPNPAALIGISEINMNLHAGRPNISIPLYNIKESNVNVPVSLTYNSGGVKVEQLATNVGLGWVLNAGGVITREVRGMADDHPLYGYFNTETFIADFDLGIKINPIDNTEFYGFDYYDILPALNGELDLEPDRFYVNAPGISITFIYDQKTKQFIQFPHSNASIERVPKSGEVEQWIVTREDGVKYYFGKNEDNPGFSGIEHVSSASSRTFNYSGTSTSSGESEPYIQAWHLTDIKTPHGKTIEFSYQLNPLVQIEERANETELSRGCEAPPYTKNFLSRTYGEVVLSEIAFSSGKIKIALEDTKRQDLVNSKAIDKIVICNNEDDTIKAYNLDYEYIYETSTLDNPFNTANDNTRRCRMYLMSVTETDKEELNPYLFSYNNRELLPERFSNAQDYWGYYNGKNNSELVPETPVLYGGQLLFMGSADRSVDTVLCKYGTLEKITYPTQGYVNFTFESNTCPKGQIPNNILTNYDTYSGGIYYDDAFMVVQFLDTLYTTTIEIPEDKWGRTTINAEISGCPADGNANDECHFQVHLEGITDPNFHMIINNGNFEIDLPSGQYKLVAKKNVGENPGPEVDFSIQYSGKYTTYNSDGGVPAGGLRLKEMKYYNSTGELARYRKYNYVVPSTQKTSGMLLSLPAYVYHRYYNGTCDPSRDVVQLTTNSINPMKQVGGNYVTYSDIIEYFSLNQNFGKIEYKFTSSHESSLYIAGDPFLVPPVITVWNSGNPLSTKFYQYTKNTGGDYTIIKETSNTYDVIQHWQQDRVGIRTLRTISSNSVGAPNTFNYAAYGLFSDYYRKNGTVQTSYYDKDAVVTTSFFSYDNNPLLPSKNTTINSSGELIEEYFFYPFDINTAVYASMTAANMLNYPVEQTTKVDGHIVKSKLTSYKRDVHFPNTDEYYVPDKVYSLETATPLSSFVPFDGFNKDNHYPDAPEVTFSDYDEKGNVLEYTGKNGITGSFFWSHNYTYPVVKAENIDYNTLKTAIENVAGTSDLETFCKKFTNVMYTNSDWDNFNENLRKTPSLKDAMITTYTYQPLVGMTSQTDPAGRTTYYEYDSFERLEYIRDHEGNIIKKYKYHYTSGSATINPIIISGCVKDSEGNGIGDVILSFSNNGGTTIANSQGYYSKTVNHGWSGTVIPVKDCHTFTDASKSYTNITSDISNQDYTGNQTFITASVETYSGCGEATGSVRVNTNIPGMKTFYLLGDDCSIIASWTDSTAYHDFTEIDDGIYRGKVIKDDCSSDCSPSQDLINTSAPLATITVTPDVGTGTITVSSNDSANQTFYLYNSSGIQLDAATVYADHYDFTGVPDGTYKGKVEREGCISDYSEEQTLTNLSSTFTISGYIKTSVGSGIDGATLSFSNNGGTVITDSLGYYSKTVNYGWSGTVTPSKDCYTFSAAKNYVNFTANMPNQDYTGTSVSIIVSVSVYPECGSGSGTVTVSSNLSGTQTFYLLDNQCNPITSWTGNVTSHTFTGRADGTYRGKIDKDGCTSACSNGVTLTNKTIPSVSSINVVPGCGTGSVTISSNLSGTQTFYLLDNQCNPITSWTGNATSHTFTGRADGTYRGKVSKDGCTSACSLEATLTNKPIPTASITAYPGCGSGSGTVTVSSNLSGTQTFYLLDNQCNPITSWTGNVTSHTFTGRADGTYRGKVSKDGCTSACSNGVTLTNKTIPSVSSINVVPGCGTGSVTISSNLSGTQTFYLLDNQCNPITSWTGNATSHTFTGRADGTYRGKVSKDGCTSACSLEATLTNKPIPTASITAYPGCGSGSGTVTVSSNLSGTQTFYLLDNQCNPITSWTGNVTSHTFTGRADGTYRGKVSKDGCTSACSDAFELQNNPIPTATISNLTPGPGIGTITVASDLSGTQTFYLYNNSGILIEQQTVVDDDDGTPNNCTFTGIPDGTYKAKVNKISCMSNYSETETLTNTVSNVTISGYVMTVGGNPISGVIITGQTTSDSSGYYEVSVNSGWTGTIQPTDPNYVFSPSSRHYMNVTSNISNQDFTGEIP